MLKAIITASLLIGSTLASNHYGGYEHEAPEVYSEPVAVYETTSCEKAQKTQHAAPEYTAVGGTYEPKTHKVVVGGDAGLVYTPEFIQAAVGDIVEFHFLKQNHSVTQSTFAKPCVRKPDGMDSGLMPNPNNTVTPAPVWKYTVDTTEATWWYCKQRTGTHCGKGMTFAINPTQEKSFEQFKSMAIAQNGTEATMPPGPAYTPPGQETVTLIGGGDKTEVAPTPAPTYVDGSGQGKDGACQCQCFCGVAAYPSGYGLNNYGGMPGHLPPPWETTAAPAATSAGGYYKR